MRFIEVKYFVPAPGQEWIVGSYPGDGVYVTAQGIAFVGGGQVYTVMVSGWQSLIKDRAHAEASTSGAAQFATIDLHHLIDQILDHGKERAACGARQPA